MGEGHVIGFMCAVLLHCLFGFSYPTGVCLGTLELLLFSFVWRVGQGLLGLFSASSLICLSGGTGAAGIVFCLLLFSSTVLQASKLALTTFNHSLLSNMRGSHSLRSNPWHSDWILGITGKVIITQKLLSICFSWLMHPGFEKFFGSSSSLALTILPM
jgi:hypothetical protein